MIASIFLFLSHCALGIFANGKHVNNRDEYGLEIPRNLQFLHFHGTKKTIKLAKKVKKQRSKKLQRNSPIEMTVISYVPETRLLFFDLRRFHCIQFINTCSVKKVFLKISQNTQENI